MTQLAPQANGSPYLTALEAAAYLRLEERTLNNMRWRGEGPSWRKHGGRVVYHKDALDNWSRERDSDPDNRPKNNNKNDNKKNSPKKKDD